MSNFKKGQSKPREDGALLPFFYKKVDDIDVIAVGKRLHAIRMQQEMTLREFGESLQLSYNTMNKLELGTVIPGGRTLVLLHEQYGVDVLWLLFGCHTTHMDLLNGLSNISDEVKFDIFTRLYSYFYSSKRDKICFVPFHRDATGVTHFSKWRDTMYQPIIDGEIADEEVIFENTVEYTLEKDELEEFVEKLSEQERVRFYNLIRKTMK